MMKPHCDRCEKLLDNYPLWCDEEFQEANKIYHVYINVDADGDAQQFCKECIIIILNTYLEVLK